MLIMIQYGSMDADERKGATISQSSCASEILSVYDSLFPWFTTILGYKVHVYIAHLSYKMADAETKQRPSLGCMSITMRS